LKPHLLKVLMHATNINRYRVRGQAPAQRMVYGADASAFAVEFQDKYELAKMKYRYRYTQTVRQKRKLRDANFQYEMIHSAKRLKTEVMAPKYLITAGEIVKNQDVLWTGNLEFRRT
jgi:hypothetical protein